MKKLVLLIVGICMILALTVCVDASASDLSFIFDATNAQINISGTLSGQSGELVSVLIDRREEGQEAYSHNNTPDAFFWYQANADGVIDVREKIASSFLGGRYDITVTGQTNQQKFTFVYVDKEAPETLALIDAINLAATSADVEAIVLADGNAGMLGIDTEDADVTKYLNSTFEDIIALRETLESKKYTIDSFIDNFSVIIAVKMTNDGRADEAIPKYSAYFGTTPDEYKALDTNVSEVLNSMLKDTEFEYDKLEEIYAEKLFVSRVKASEAWGYLQELVLSSKETLEISLTEYNDIKESARYKVFEKMYDKAASFASYSDIKNCFNEAVESVKNEIAETPKESGRRPSGGGGSSVSVPQLTPPAVVNPEYNAVDGIQNVEFSDIEGHFAQDYIKTLASDGMINGYEDGSFKPDNTITRAEFAKLVSVIFEITSQDVQEYEDVKSDDWFKPYVDKLSGAGIVTGYDGKFSPYDNITRQDAAVICLRISEKCSAKLDGESEFADKANIASYALEAVGALSANEIMNGDGTNFYPLNNLTRGETAAILCRLKAALK